MDYRMNCEKSHVLRYDVKFKWILTLLLSRVRFRCADLFISIIGFWKSLNWRTAFCRSILQIEGLDKKYFINLILIISIFQYFFFFHRIQNHQQQIPMLHSEVHNTTEGCLRSSQLNNILKETSGPVAALAANIPF